MRQQDFIDILTALERGSEAALAVSAEGRQYIRRFVPKERLILLGGGHVSQQLCRFASMLDFAVTAVDDRAAFANAERFPDAQRIICDDYAAAIDGLGIRPSDCVCVLTRGHKYDAACVRRLLGGAMPGYLGMIGSRRRVSGFIEVLRQEGYGEERIAMLHAPIGLDIGAVTPEEIAVSICAQLIQHRHSAPADKTSLPQTNADMRMLRFLAESSGQKAVLLVLDSSGSTPVKGGAMMAVDKEGRGYGTIGGGYGEAEAMRRAMELMDGQMPEIIEVDMTNEVAAEEGMVCGGSMRVLILPMD